MSDFDTEMLAARQAQAEVWDASVRLDRALEARGRAIAKARALRPGGVTWDDMVEMFNHTLPPAARLKVSALRLDELHYREAVPEVASHDAERREETA